MYVPKNILGLDFESFFAKDYSLRQQHVSMTEYVRDPRFKAHGVGVRTGRQKKSRWVTHNKLVAYFATVDWKNTAILCHQAQFDAFILYHHYGIVPAYFYCTLSMARPLHGNAIPSDLDSVARFYGHRGKQQGVLEETKGIRDLSRAQDKRLGGYCCTDVDAMWHIFRCMLEEYPPDELDLIHYTVKAYANPLLHVDIPEAQRQHKKELRKRHRLVKKTGGTIKDFASREKFATLLRTAGCTPPLKISPTTGEPTYAFAKSDLAFQELKLHPSEAVRDLVEARLICATNINLTRALRLISHADPALPLFLKYGGAHTLRWSGGDKNNPQNYPRDGRLRRCIIAPPGYMLVVIDSRQIEARWNAFLAGQEDLVQAFREGRDIYSEFAAEEVYHIPLKKVKKTPHRFVGKVSILQLGYQSAWEKFQLTLANGSQGDVTVLENAVAQAIVRNYRQRYSKIKDQWYFFQNQFPLMRDGGSLEYGPIVFEKERVWLPNDMYIRYPRIRSITQEGKQWPQWVYNEDRKIYGGQFVQNIIEALARITVAEQVLRIAEKYRVVNLIHDEVILCVPKRSAEAALRFGLKQFDIPPKWAPDLPVAGEGSISDRYAKN